MDYLQAKQQKSTLENKVRLAENKLKEFDRYGKSAMGLTPDAVKAMPEFKAAKSDFDRAFAKLREFNGNYVKAFKKEIREERR